MGSRTAQFFHDHVLVKEPGTQKATPWHQDMPYYFVDGRQTVSFWIPIDPVKEATLRVVAGSHKWDRMILPVRWLDDSSFYATKESYRPVPDPDHDPGHDGPGMGNGARRCGSVRLPDRPRRARQPRLQPAPGAVVALGR